MYIFIYQNSVRKINGKVAKLYNEILKDDTYETKIIFHFVINFPNIVKAHIIKSFCWLRYR